MAQNKKCEIIIFGEVHSDVGSTKAILDLLKPLTSKGYRDYLFEEPSDHTYKTVYKNIELTKKYYLNIFKKNIEDVLSKVGVPGPLSEKQILEIHKTDDMPNVIKLHTTQYVEFKETYQTTLKLIAKIYKSTDLKLHFVDLPYSEKDILVQKGVLEDEFVTKRDQYMATRAEEICVNGGNKQVLLVGLEHHGIRDILKSKGFTVNVFAVFKYKPLNEINLPKDLSQEDLDDQLYNFRVREAADSTLANQQYKLENVKIIDLYKHPELNVTEILLDIIHTPKTDYFTQKFYDFIECIGDPYSCWSSLVADTEL